MGIAVVGRYAMLSEAWVVCSALRSAGIPAEVFDHYRGTMIWTQQTLLGGFRVAVPTRDLDDAYALLQEVGPKPEPIKGVGWTVPAMALAFLCFWSGIAMWGYFEAKTRPAPWRTATFVVLLVLESLGLVALIIELSTRPRF
jgi:hypothetical protein